MYQFSEIKFALPAEVTPPVVTDEQQQAFSLGALALLLRELLTLNDDEHLALVENLERHIGAKSTFTKKQELLTFLLHIFHVLSHEATLSKKTAIASGCVVDIEMCTNGFYNRVTAIYQSIFHPQTLEHWLLDIRTEIVERAARLASNDIHVHNRYFTRASMHYGVKAIAPDDVYRGEMSDKIIDADLVTAFDNYYQPLAILTHLTERFEQMILAMGLSFLIDTKHYDQTVIDEISEKSREFFHHHQPNIYDVIVFKKDIPSGVNRVNLKKRLFKELVARGYFNSPDSLEYLVGRLLAKTPSMTLIKRITRRLVVISPWFVVDLINDFRDRSDEEKLMLLQTASEHLSPDDFMGVLASTAHHFNQFEMLAEHFNNPLLTQFFFDAAWWRAGLHNTYRHKEHFHFCLRTILLYKRYDLLSFVSISGQTSLMRLEHFPSTFEFCLPLLCQIPKRYLLRLLNIKVNNMPNWVLKALQSEKYSAASLNLFFAEIGSRPLHELLTPIFTHETFSGDIFIKTLSADKLNLLFRLCHRAKLSEVLEQYSYSQNQSLIHVAANRGALEIVKHYFSKYGVIDCKDKGKRTPLYLAAQAGHLEIVKFLVEQGASINAVTEKNITPLHAATVANQLAVVQYLIAKGANIEALDLFQQTPLHHAASYGRIEIAKALIQAGANLLAVNKDAHMALHVATIKNHFLIVQLLLSNAVAIDVPDAQGNTPLHLAARYGRDEILKSLIERGAGIEVKNTLNQTPLFSAVLNNREEIVRFLLEHHAEVNAADSSGATPLYYAAAYDFRAIITLLFLHHAEIGRANHKRQTPLHVAATHNKTALIPYLIEQGAHVNAPDINRLTPLHATAVYGHIEAAQVLIAHGADVHSPSILMQTPFHIAVMQKNMRMVEFLLGQGASIDAIDSQKNTALHYAVMHKCEDIVRFLIAHEARLTIKNDLGKTPLDLANEGGLFSIAGLILGAEADALPPSLLPLDCLMTFFKPSAESTTTLIAEAERKREGEALDSTAKRP